MTTVGGGKCYVTQTAINNVLEPLSKIEHILHHTSCIYLPVTDIDIINQSVTLLSYREKYTVAKVRQASVSAAPHPSFNPTAKNPPTHQPTRLNFTAHRSQEPQGSEPSPSLPCHLHRRLITALTPQREGHILSDVVPRCSWDLFVTTCSKPVYISHHSTQPKTWHNRE